MPIYDAKSIPREVYSSTKDPEVAAFLRTGPVLGAHKPIHVQRVEHNAFIDKVSPPIGKTAPRLGWASRQSSGARILSIQAGTGTGRRSYLRSWRRFHRRYAGSV